MSVRLTFAGSGDAFAGGGRFNTCLHLEADRRHGSASTSDLYLPAGWSRSDPYR